MEASTAISAVPRPSVTETSTATFIDPATRADAPPARRWEAAGALTLAVVLMGVSVSVALGVVLQRVHNDNEARLVHQRTLEAAAVVMAAVPGIESPLASAAEFSEATDGDVIAPFRRLLGPIVERGNPFVAASIWQLNGTNPDLVDEIGVPLKLSADGHEAEPTNSSLAPSQLTA